MNLTKIDSNETDWTANICYGRLLESAYVSEHGIDRACAMLELLIEDDRWMSVGPGYDDIDTFLGTITLAEFKISVERRKKLVKLLSERRATQRAAAKMLGVDHRTIGRDLQGENAPNTDIETQQNQDVSKTDGANAPNTEIEDEGNQAVGEADVPNGTNPESEHEEPGKPHVAHNSGENEWYTPPEYIEAVVNVMGGIDLDPASSDAANQTVKAAKYFTKENSGLDKHWAGRVFMNPPYASGLIGKFVSKFTHHRNNGDIQEAIVLVNNATDTSWFVELVGCASAVVFSKGRVKFLDPDGKPGAPLQGQAFIYCGDNPKKFVGEFMRFGWGAEIIEKTPDEY